MYAPDNQDKIKGVGRVLRAMASAPTLDPEDMPEVFARIRRNLAAAEDMAVANLRGQGHSWATIGAAMGMSRQGCVQRFGQVVEDLAAAAAS